MKLNIDMKFCMRHAN